MDASQQQQKQNRVRFPQDEDAISNIVCRLPSLDEFSEEDFELLWFSKADYHMSRSAAKIISRESVRFGFSKNLDDTYTEKSSGAQERLQLWTTQGHARRGLERWANKDHGERRQMDQFDAIMAVLESQDELIAKSKDGVIDVEKIRKISHKATKTARHFARMIGKADSFAMACELEKPQRSGVINIDGMGGDSETVATANTTRSGQTESSGTTSGTTTTASPRKSPHSKSLSIKSLSSKSFPKSPGKKTTPVVLDDDAECESMPSVIDGLKDSCHISKASRFRRFKFGVNSLKPGSNSKPSLKMSPAEEERVSRIA